MKKKMLVVALASAMILSLTACGGNKDKETSSVPDTETVIEKGAETEKESSDTKESEQDEKIEDETPPMEKNEQDENTDKESPAVEGSEPGEQEKSPAVEESETSEEEPEESTEQPAEEKPIESEKEDTEKKPTETTKPTESKPEEPESKPEPASEPKPEPHTHNYSSSVTQNASCTADGVKTFTCSCGDSYTESIPTIGHSWNKGEYISDATCSSEAVKRFTCTACGATEDRKTGEYSEHSWIHEDAQGEYQDVIIGYDEHTWTVCRCGAKFYSTSEYREHSKSESQAGELGSHGGCSTEKESEPIYESQWVETKPARDYCSVCGAEK